MSPTLEETHLRKAIMTMLCQLCKVSITYSGELTIEGTLGVTVDREKVILIHFDDRVVRGDTGYIRTDTPGDAPLLGGVCLTTSDAADTEECTRLLGAEALSSLLVGSGALSPGTRSGRRAFSGSVAEIDSSALASFSTVPTYRLGRSAAGPETFKMMNCFQETASTNGDLLDDQTLNERIAIDVDSDSFNSLQLDEIASPSIASVDDRVSFPTTFGKQIRGEEVGNNGFPLLSSTRETRGLGRGKQLKRRTGRGKTVIVIDDKEGLFNTRINSASTGGTDVKSIGGGSACSSFRCENLPQTEFVSVSSPNSGPTNNDIARFTTSPAPVDKDDCMTDTKRFYCATGCRFTCDICAARLKTVSLLESHLIARHGIVEHAQLGRITHFACKHCAKRFRFQAQHDKHVVRHDATNLRLHRCRRCRNTYRCAGSLRLHAMSHDGVLTCDVCDKSYANRVLFQKHIVYKHEKKKDVSPEPSE